MVETLTIVKGIKKEGFSHPYPCQPHPLPFIYISTICICFQHYENGIYGYISLFFPFLEKRQYANLF